MSARALMLLGTHSNAGKSLLATAFCRILARRGVRVAPFKAQNMSNNAGVTPIGGEMGRAQIVQAEAARIAPHTDMNPVLLKPEANRRSQIILNGAVHGHIEAGNWYDVKRDLWPSVQAAYDRLAARYDVIIMEGAGSPAEINLKAGDIVNLRMAAHAGAPCLLVGDIDRGGVFAALAGTLLLLDAPERARVRGFLINKFRGDPALLGDATQMLQARAYNTPTLGVIPFIPDLQIADEDAVALDQPNAAPLRVGEIDIAIIQLPHIANFDEFGALGAEAGVRVRYVRDVRRLGEPHALILPGSKVTLDDLAWLRRHKFDEAILALGRNGTPVAGICGGYQLLGQRLADPDGVEMQAGTEAAGLGLLPVRTEFCEIKETHQAKLRLGNGAIVSGYEIHAGNTTYLNGATRLGEIIERNGEIVSVPDGASADAGRIWGTYLHGIFQNEEFRRSWLHSLGWRGAAQSGQALQQREYDRLADVVESHVDWGAIEALLA